MMSRQGSRAWGQAGRAPCKDVDLQRVQFPSGNCGGVGSDLMSSFLASIPSRAGRGLANKCGKRGQEVGATFHCAACSLSKHTANP